MTDEVVQAPWCAACRRSCALKWSRHAFSAGHQAAALRFLRARAAELERLAAAATETAANGFKWRCRVCEEDGERVEGGEWGAGVEHFASEEHRRSVEAFCRRMRCDHERKTRSQLWLEPDKGRKLLQQREDARRKEAAKAKRAETEVSRAWKAEAFLASAAARLQEVQAQREATVDVVDTKTINPAGGLGPPTVSGAFRVKTIESRSGILQNPLGRHNGERVWGGGIVKVKSNDWIPWGIDLLVREEQARRATGLVVASGNEETSFSHRMTEMAFGEGLGSITCVNWAQSVGNVHTGAVPPWLVASEEEYKKQNQHQSPASAVAAVENTKTHGPMKAQKSHDPNWLPNFGGVWESGPRSRTKQSFQKSVKSHRKREAPQPFDRSAQFVPSQVQPPLPPLPSPRSALPPPLRVPPEMESAPTESLSNSTTVDVSAHPTAIESTPDIYSADADGKPHLAQVPIVPPHQPSLQPPPPQPELTEFEAPVTALDAKRKQLMAQKERLRAKFAARRQR